MEEIEEKLSLKILEVDWESRRVIFGAWTQDETAMTLGVADCDTERDPMWLLVVPAWPEVAESTVKAMREPLFQDYFSLLFVKFHEGKDCFLTVNNECGNVSFHLMEK